MIPNQICVMHNLLLFAFLCVKAMKVIAFHCSSDSTTNEVINEFHMEKNSIATKFRSIDSLFVFDRPCHCEYDWKSAFCAKLNFYRRLPKSESPSICICRQFDGLKHGCLQFTTRCFPSSESSGFRQSNSAESSKCRCCFNQPDDYCNQLDCSEMKPTFGLTTNTSCLCYSHNNYPDWICSSKKARVGLSKVKLYNGLSSTDNEKIDEMKAKKNWPYTENIAFVEDINFKRRIQNSHEDHTSKPIKQLQQSSKPDVNGIWIGENVVMLPMLVATCVVLLGLTGFGCFLLIVTKMHSKSRSESNGVILVNTQPPTTKQPILKGRYEKNNSGSPNTSTRIIQNKLDHNAIRLTHSMTSTKKQLLNPPCVKFASMPRSPEICELVYNNPCTCKKPSVTLTV